MTIRLVDLRGDQRTMGYQRGFQLRDVIYDRLRQQDILLEQAGISVSDCSVVSTRFRATLEDLYPVVLDEIVGIAQGARLELEDLLRLLFGARAVSAMPGGSEWLSGQEDCTVLGIPRQRDSRSATSLLAKNADVPLHYAGQWTVARCRPSDGIPYVSAGFFPEMPGGTEGMNGLGFCAVGAGVYTWDGYEMMRNHRRRGVPVSLIWGEMLRTCSSIEEAASFLRNAPTGPLGRNCLLGDSGGSIVLFEKSSTRHFTTQRANGGVAAASIFQSSSMAGLGATISDDPSGHGRTRRANELLAALDRSPTVNVYDLAAVCADHGSGTTAEALCRHGPELHTLASVIFEPTAGQMWVCEGRPCENTFESIEVGIPDRVREVQWEVSNPEGAWM